MRRIHSLLPVFLLVAACASPASPPAAPSVKGASSASPTVAASPSSPSVAATSSPLPSAASPSATTSPSAVAPSASSASETGPGGIVVIGHSGATGWNSDPANPGVDVKANSWATGSNPDVDSIYLRSLATDPTLEGKAWNYAISGSEVTSLLAQANRVVTTNPTADLVLVQSIDNDIRCDGTDSENYEPYRASLTQVVDTLTQGMPKARIFFVSQWADVKTYDRVAFSLPPDHLAGDGPCDTVDPKTKKIVPAKETSFQGLVDDYFGIVTEVCARYPTCKTDAGANQDMDLVAEDLTPDMNHLSVAGHAKMAALEWKALSASGG